MSRITLVRGRRGRGAALVAATAALLMIAASSAQSDDFDNDLDAGVDADLEIINLTWNPNTLTGTSGSTNVSIIIRGHFDDPVDHSGCNIQGGHHYVAVEATSSNTAVAVVSNGPSYTFDACSDTNLVTVTATGVGTAVISFAIDEENTNNDPNLTFTTSGADFQVNVTEDTSNPPPVGCDKDPAAPAWAAAILQKSGYKPGAKQTVNLISQVAQHMTTMARFDGINKADHPAYEDAVDAYLEAITGKDLVTAQQAARPGWVCSLI